MSTAVSILYSLAVLFLLWAFYIYLGYRSKKRAWGNKVNEWFPEEKRKSFISVVGDRFDQSKQAEALSNKLIGANVPLLPSEYLGIHILGFFILFILIGKFFKTSASINILISIGILIGAHFLMFYLRKNKYEERFNDQLSDICRLLGSAAKSGLTISQGIDLVSKEIPAPAGKEFKGISNQLKLGVPLEIALRSIQKRNKSRDFQLFISTILIQTKTGGNLAATLETMSNTLEDRKILNQTIKTMTSEQRYVSFIVPALPIFILLVMNNVVDGFTDPLWTLPGIIILILFLLGIIISFILIRKISDIKV
ncbi:type II secretion system F family protein [Heyndrickxia oleronia]|jgi:tight adherence protein B|uniref:type II secretion system F family protein n=1 Tax=Heyndrickxia oleronia TaxID=38875 RepID=UPI00243124ED|nr:type II secretion system F family protein [Heyndrickxia oleronia]MCI1591753.1 type II secretion system F family protein [Heyndrickxia oleronia]MCI1614953.1 type II secretion system F family protein [Heyndrickxia oleronia]MCI1745820.1 type II secretion system F family protein [Heyndrickxia oleronia]MCI1763719.1 type II secretion system F family protein [Heyndrickxia oleronia]